MIDWLYFALLVVVVGLLGIGVGVVVGRAIAARAARREGTGEDAFMTPVGTPEAEPGADLAWPGEAGEPGGEAAQSPEVGGEAAQGASGQGEGPGTAAAARDDD